MQKVSVMPGLMRMRWYLPFYRTIVVRNPKDLYGGWFVDFHRSVQWLRLCME